MIETNSDGSEKSRGGLATFAASVYLFLFVRWMSHMKTRFKSFLSAKSLEKVRLFTYQ